MSLIFRKFTLKLIVVLSCALGLYLCFSSADGFMGGARFLLYFTIQSNIWIAGTCLVGLIWMYKNRKNGFQIESLPYYKVKFMFTVAITLTGGVYCFILAPFVKGAWALSQVLVHVVVPVAAILDFFIADGKENSKLSYRNSLLALIPPAYYVLFAALGYVCHWNFSGGLNYPYFFLNWGWEGGIFGISSEVPFLGTGLWVLLMIPLMTGAGCLFIRGTKRRKK